MIDKKYSKHVSLNHVFSGFIGLEEFEEKIDKIDKDRDGSHPWLEEMLHNLRKAKKDAENSDKGVGKEHNQQRFSNQDTRLERISF